MRLFAPRPYRQLLILSGALALVATICGMVLARQHPRLTPQPTSLPTSRIAGIGLNCHAERLPIADIKSIGISWVRLDLQGNQYTPDKLKGLVGYYRDFGQLWILPQTARDRIETAKTMIAAGITEIEVFNEPDRTNITPESYAGIFQKIRAAVAGRARLYGPDVGTQSTDYLDGCIRHGAQFDVIAIHGYNQKSFPSLTNWTAGIKDYGVPVAVTELGFPTYLGKMPYRVKMRDSLGTLFLKTKNALEDTPWCWYDGPNPADDNDSGMFDWVPNRGYVPNRNYRSIRAALQGAGQ
ncbi:MAG: glycosyl hydrolase [Fimbriimonadales bacterium]